MAREAQVPSYPIRDCFTVFCPIRDRDCLTTSGDWHCGHVAREALVSSYPIRDCFIITAESETALHFSALPETFLTIAVQSKTVTICCPNRDCFIICCPIKDCYNYNNRRKRVGRNTRSRTSSLKSPTPTLTLDNMCNCVLLKPLRLNRKKKD